MNRYEAGPNRGNASPPLSRNLPHRTEAWQAGGGTGPETARSSQACQWKNCDATFPSGEELYRHICEEHTTKSLRPNAASNRPVFNCLWGDCKITVNKRDHLVSHVRVHVDIWPYVCETCSRKFRRPQDLRKHMGTSLHSQAEAFSQQTAAAKAAASFSNQELAIQPTSTSIIEPQPEDSGAVWTHTAPLPPEQQEQQRLLMHQQQLQSRGQVQNTNRASSEAIPQESYSNQYVDLYMDQFKHPPPQHPSQQHFPPQHPSPQHLSQHLSQQHLSQQHPPQPLAPPLMSGNLDRSLFMEPTSAQESLLYHHDPSTHPYHRRPWELSQTSHVLNPGMSDEHARRTARDYTDQYGNHPDDQSGVSGSYTGGYWYPADQSKSTANYGTSVVSSPHCTPVSSTNVSPIMEASLNTPSDRAPRRLSTVSRSIVQRRLSFPSQPNYEADLITHGGRPHAFGMHDFHGGDGMSALFPPHQSPQQYWQPEQQTPMQHHSMRELMFEPQRKVEWASLANPQLKSPNSGTPWATSWPAAQYPLLESPHYSYGTMEHSNEQWNPPYAQYYAPVSSNEQLGGIGIHDRQLLEYGQPGPSGNTNAELSKFNELRRKRKGSVSGARRRPTKQEAADKEEHDRVMQKKASQKQAMQVYKELQSSRESETHSEFDDNSSPRAK